ncbi:MAG: ribbon-helix-helix domain-containing protein [Rhodospirillaceae bacterium]
MTNIQNSGFEHEPVERIFTLGGVALRLCLEQALWDAFDDISIRESLSGDELCARIDREEPEGGFAEKVARFACEYYRDAMPPLRHGMSEDDGRRSALQQALDAVGPKS